MFQSGNEVGHYRLVEKIGEGGMGEVWLASDARLDRDVALKVLPEKATLTPDRLDRFTREAKLLASLNHPGIATIHDVDEHEGVRFLVMELVPGDDLATELERGPLPVREALEVALNIAKALEAAHGQGVIHRDLKPANVKRLAGNLVKVLDFGLAKAMEPAPVSGEQGVSVSPTITTAGTLAGVILGTAAYMSPEQARGRPVDKRTDVWSFGVLLYELLTGDNPFRCDTVADTVGAIMHRDPDLDALPSETPPAVRRLLRRCVTRERASRLHDIADARIELEDAIAHPEAEIPSAVGAVGAAPVRVSRLPWVLLAAVVPIAAVLGWLVASGGDEGAPPPTRRFKLSHDVEVHAAVIAPDGRRIAYVADNQLLIRSLDSLEPRTTAVDVGEGTQIFWSPDSRTLGIFKPPNELLRFDLDGGAPVVLSDSVDFVNEATWSDDGFIYYSQFQGGISRLPEMGGAPETVMTAPKELIDYHGFAVLPQGRGFVTIPHLMDADAKTIVLEVAGEEPEVLYTSDSTIDGLHVSPTGHLVFHRQENPVGMWAIPFSLESLRTTGEPFLVVADLGEASFSASGDMLYPQSALQSGKQKQALFWVDRTGREVDRLDTGLSGAYFPSVSPDGSKVALIATGIGRPPTDPPGLWVIDLQRGTSSRVSAGRIVTSRPSWNADGTRIAYIEAKPAEGGGKNVVSVRADGTGDRRVLFTADVNFFFDLSADWSIASFARGSVTGENGMAIAVETPGDPTSLSTFVDSPDHDVAPVIHPSGNWIAYMSGDMPRMEVVVRPFPEGEGQWKVSRGSSWMAQWSADGTRLTYIEQGPEDGFTGGDLMEVTFDDSGPTPAFGTPVRLFSIETQGVWQTPDGRFIQIEDVKPAEGEEAPDVKGIVIVENWAGQR
ncbi:MAG: protein kinase [Candidatus Sulfomarinibacteraceae bacterium]